MNLAVQRAEGVSPSVEVEAKVVAAVIFGLAVVCGWVTHQVYPKTELELYPPPGEGAGFRIH
jgi:hypothetical protein